MGRFIDLTGQKFGRLTAERISGEKYRGQIKWVCRCECGNTTTVVAQSLKNGNTRSCGCLHNEQATQENTKHGCCHTHLWNIWMKIKGKCYTVNNNFYEYYGAKGITVCGEWLDDFNAFKEWAIDNGYSKATPIITRIDKTGNYNPLNCKFIKPDEKGSNKINNLLITYKGETKTIAEFAKEYNITPSTLNGRVVKLKWDVATALTTPVKHKTGGKRDEHSKGRCNGQDNGRYTEG